MNLCPFRKTILLPFLLLFSCFAVRSTAQKNFIDGYVVKKNGDSLRGLIDYRDWGASPHYIDFQNNGDQTVEKFGARDIRAFGMKGERYESFGVRFYPFSLHPDSLTSLNDMVTPYDSTVFLQVLTAGSRMTLWEYRLPPNQNYFFVSGAGGRPEQLRIVTRVTDNNGSTFFQQLPVFRDQLTIKMGDCAAVQARIGHTDYSEAPLRKLVFSFNNCGKDTMENREKVTNGGAVRVFPFVGFASTTVKFQGPDDPAGFQHYPVSNSLTAGIGALFILPRNRERYSILVDVGWQHVHSVSDSARATYVTAIGHMEYSLLMAETLLRYRFPSSRWRPFIEGGMAFGAAYDFNCYQSGYYHLGATSPYNEPMLGGAFHHFQTGFILGAGVGERHWGLEARMETSGGISDLVSTSSTTTSLFLLLSYSL